MNSFGYVRDQPRPPPISKQEREDLEERERESRIAMLTQQQAKYHGFHAPDGSVRASDLDAFRAAVRAPWRKP